MLTKARQRGFAWLGATCLLNPVKHLVKVIVTRPSKQRVEWLMDRLATDDLAFAEDEVGRSDQAHASRMNEQFGVPWGDPLLFDLVLNTDRVSIASCVALIEQLAGRSDFQETESSRAMLSALALNARIRAALKDHESTRDLNIQIESDRANVILKGIILNDQEKTDAEKIAGQCQTLKAWAMSCAS